MVVCFFTINSDTCSQRRLFVSRRSYLLVLDFSRPITVFIFFPVDGELSKAGHFLCDQQVLCYPFLSFVNHLNLSNIICRLCPV